MADHKKKGKITFEKTAIVEEKGVTKTIHVITVPNWNPGKSRSKFRPTAKKKRDNPRVMVVKCGGENKVVHKMFGRDSKGDAIMKTMPCVSPFQDQLYGKDMRVCNPAESKGAKKGTVRCTVCLKLHTPGN